MIELKDLLKALILVENAKKELDSESITQEKVLEKVSEEPIVENIKVSCFDKLKEISEVETLNFDDGSSLNINEECSSLILNLYESLTDASDKVLFENMVNSSDKSFLRILELSVKYSDKEEE